MAKYKLLAVSDVDSLNTYPIEYLKDRFSDIDFIISAGDLSYDYLDYLVSALDKDLIYVNGNHIYNNNHDISFCKCIDGKVLKYNGLKFLGLDGSMVYSYKKHQYTEKEMTMKIVQNLTRILIKKPDIVVSHASPKGIHDRSDPAHRGFEIFLRVIEYFKPKLWIHGHIHLKSPHDLQETVIGQTRIVNAYGFKVIDLEV